jgi:hypothetical protein
MKPTLITIGSLTLLWAWYFALIHYAVGRDAPLTATAITFSAVMVGYFGYKQIERLTE